MSVWTTLSAILILGFASPASPATDPVRPHQTFTIESKLLGETRRINVYTPPGYENAKSRYPVLYMSDGGVDEDFPHVASDIDAVIRAGEMRPVIVVGIENTERRRDMTGPTEVESDKKIAIHVGGSAHFRAFIRDELMPVIRERFRVNGERAIVGESLAGLFIVESFFEEPELFDTYIALSPSLWWNDQALVRRAGERLRSMALAEDKRRSDSPVRLPDDSQRKPSDWRVRPTSITPRPGLNATLYLASAGDDDRGDAVKAMAAILRADAPKGLTWYYELRSDLQHSTIYKGVSPGVFRKLFPPR